MKYLTDSFSSVAELISQLESRPHVDDMGEASDDRSNNSWAGTESYEAATKLALYGDKDSAAKVVNTLKKIKAQTASYDGRAQSRTVRTVVGSRPCVPAAIMGRPDSMYRRYAVHTKKPVITIYYSMAASCNVDSSAIVSAGAQLAEAIQIIERSGVRVNLYAGNMAGTETQRILMFVRIKDSAKDFDLLRMAYVLINPSFLRRHYFKYVETKQHVKADAWKYSYGRPLRDKEFDEAKAELTKQTKLDKLISFYDIDRKSADEIVNMITGAAK